MLVKINEKMMIPSVNGARFRISIRLSIYYIAFVKTTAINRSI